MSTTTEYPNQDDLDELQELMERVGEADERMEKVVRVAAVDIEFYNDLRAIYQRKAAQVATKDAYYPYTALDGEFMIGTDLDGRPLGLTRRQLNEHMLVVGRTGAGKTTFFYNLVDALHGKDVPFMLFDFKNDYRHVANDFDLTVINWRELRFNPLQPPPGVSIARWGEVLAETFAHATDLLIGSQSYFLEKLRQLYRLYEDEAADGVYPSLFELRELVRADEMPVSSPKFNYKERVDGRLTMMTGFSGEIFDCSSGYPLDELLDRNVVFELQEPNQHVQTFMIEVILAWIFYYRDALGHRQGLRHAILFDEAKRVFDVNREKQPESGFPPIDDLMGKIREFGEALIVADHEPSKLTDSLKANTNAKLWLSLGSGHDVEEMATTFGVEDDQVDFTRTLDRGEAVLATAEQNPVPVQLPPYHVEKTPSEAATQEATQAVLNELSVENRVRPDRFWEAIGRFDHGDDSNTSTDESGQDVEPEADNQAVGEVAEALLVSVNDQPFLPMSERYNTIDVGAKTGNEAKNQLLALDLVSEEEVDSKKPGRNPKLLELTQRGKQALEDRGHEVAAVGRRGITHRYWQHQVKERYEADGYDVEIEHAVGQEHIDVYAEQDGEQMAAEVACSPEHEVANVRKCLRYGVDQVAVVYLEGSTREQIEVAVRDAFGTVPDQVTFVPATEFT